MGDLLQELRDRMDVIDTFNKYQRAVDTRDWDLYSSVITDDIVIEYVSEVADSAPVRLEGRDQVLNEYRTFFGIVDASYHVGANHEVWLDGDLARARFAYRDINERTDASGRRLHFEALGFIEAQLVRAPGAGWRIKSFVGTTVMYPGTTEQEMFAPVIALDTTQTQPGEGHR